MLQPDQPNFADCVCKKQEAVSPCTHSSKAPEHGMHRPGVTPLWRFEWVAPGPNRRIRTPLCSMDQSLQLVNMRSKVLEGEGECQPGPAAASAGGLGARQQPGLLDFDQDALNKVLARTCLLMASENSSKLVLSADPASVQVTLRAQPPLLSSALHTRMPVGDELPLRGRCLTARRCSCCKSAASPGLILTFMIMTASLLCQQGA